MAQRVLLALLALSATTIAVEARLMLDGSIAARQLQQVNTRCPAGCASDGCVLDSTSGGYKCIRCQNNLVVNSDDGTCGCPAGRYAKTANDCTDCDKGSYCLGGTYSAVNSPGKTDCGTDLTTIGKRSTSIKACVNVPGTFYSVDASGTPSSTTCPADSYGPGLRKQRACVPCPPGYTTNGATGQSQARACVVPEGYYLKGPGQVAPCPKGEYKAGFAPAPSCTKCAAGVTTLAEASTSEANRTQVLPGYYPATITSNIVKATEKCPQKFYCTGGAPTAAFNPAAPSAVAGTTVSQCADGTWTQQIGSTSADQCMTPPGYKTTGGSTTECGDGEYRAEWKPAAAASSCSVCGDGIMSNPTEQITQYAITPDATPSSVAVRATAAACYIKPGQGMYFSAATNTYKGVNCDSNNYGVSNITYGLAAFPCRDCPAGMQTSTSLSNSAAYYVSDSASPAHQGFTSPMACVTKAGYGYNGRVANKCPAGWWNPAGTYSTCTQCGFGLSTLDDANSQVDAANCTLSKGYGFHDGAVQLCPVGTYNDALRNDTTSPCTSCLPGLSTSQAGGVTSDDCNVCALGYGGSGSGSTCSSQCGGSNGANYGPAGRSAGSTCVECPAQTTGFSFDYLAVNQNFTPAVVARTGADSPADCLSEFAQIVDAAWYLGGSVTLTPVSSASTFDACVADCQADANCQYVTYDYDAASNKCSKKVVGSGSDVVAFKAVVAGDTSAASKRTRGKGLASGSYTFWQDTAAGIGADVSSSGPTSSVQACLSACDNAADCAGVVMTGLTSATAAPSGCSLIKGDSTVATFKRSMTKAVADRLALSAVFP